MGKDPQIKIFFFKDLKIATKKGPKHLNFDDYEIYCAYRLIGN